MTMPTQDALIHWSDYASQPNLRIACDQTWTTPLWGPKRPKCELPEGVYIAGGERLYSFDLERVTCPECKQRMTTRTS